MQIDFPEFRIIGVYFSQNEKLQTFKQDLQDLSVVIGEIRRKESVILGNVNVKASAWGSPIEEQRGRELDE